jgi:tetrahydromethanopterin S-methyltransferase subunit F
MAAKLAPSKTQQQVTAPGTEVALDLSSLSAHIATELAAGLSDAEAVRERYDITLEQWDVLRRNPTFREMVKDAITKLRGDLNAGKRITLKSEIALEDSIGTLYLMANDSQIPAAARVEAIKTMAGLAGRNMKGEAGAVGGGGSGFAINIQINTGSEEKVVSVENKQLALDPA